MLALVNNCPSQARKRLYVKSVRYTHNRKHEVRETRRVSRQVGDEKEGSGEGKIPKIYYINI